MEVCVLGTVGRCRGHGAVTEGDIVQSRDSVKHAQADLGQGDLEGLGEAPQLDGGLVPVGSLVIQRPPDDGVVWVSFHPKVHICSSHRDSKVIVPVRVEGWVSARSTRSDLGNPLNTHGRCHSPEGHGAARGRLPEPGTLKDSLWVEAAAVLQYKHEMACREKARTGLLTRLTVSSLSSTKLSYFCCNLEDLPDSEILDSTFQTPWT